jgi:hypothetical protein
MMRLTRAQAGDIMFKNAVQLFEIFGFKLKVDPSWL